MNQKKQLGPSALFLCLLLLPGMVMANAVPLPGGGSVVSIKNIVPDVANVGRYWVTGAANSGSYYGFWSRISASKWGSLARVAGSPWSIVAALLVAEIADIYLEDDGQNIEYYKVSWEVGGECPSQLNNERCEYQNCTIDGSGNETCTQAYFEVSHLPTPCQYTSGVTDYYRTTQSDLYGLSHISYTTSYGGAKPGFCAGQNPKLYSTTEINIYKAEKQAIPVKPVYTYDLEEVQQVAGAAVPLNDDEVYAELKPWIHPYFEMPELFEPVAVPEEYPEQLPSNMPSPVRVPGSDPSTLPDELLDPLPGIYPVDDPLADPPVEATDPQREVMPCGYGDYPPCATVSKIESDSLPEPDFTDSADQVMDEIGNLYDGVQSEIDNTDFSFLDNLEHKWTSIMPPGMTCNDYTMTFNWFGDTKTVVFPFTKLAQYRIILEWAVYMLVLIYIYKLAMSAKPS